MDARRGIRGLVIDLEGTLYVGSDPLPGVPEALERLRRGGVPMRFLTNTTSRPRRAVLARLAGMRLPIDPGAVFTAPAAAADFLKGRGVRRACFLLADEVIPDLDGIEAAESEVDAVVIGDLGEGFTYARLNQAFRLLLDGAEFYALAENRMYRRPEGMCLDVGAYVRALEYASGRRAVLLGKPARALFDAAAHSLGLPADVLAAVGDDLEGDVGGGQGAGMKGILVRTGKFRAEELSTASIRPDLVVDSFADLPGALGM